MRTSLQVNRACKISKDLGRGSVVGDEIKNLTLYSADFLLLRGCWNNMFELRTTLCPLEEFYKLK